MPPWQRMAKRGHTASESLQTPATPPPPPPPPPAAAAAHEFATANKEGETNTGDHTAAAHTRT